MSYFRLATSKAFAETKKFWNIHRIWALGSVPIVGFLLHAIIRRSRLIGWQEVLLFVIFGFIVSWLGSYLINLVHVPAILHSEQAQVITEIERNKLLLQTEVDELKRPHRSASEEKDYQEVRALVDQCSEIEKTILQHLRKVEKMVHTHSSQLSPLPPTLRHEVVNYNLISLESKRLIIRETQTWPGGWQVTLRIANWAKSALDELL